MKFVVFAFGCLSLMLSASNPPYRPAIELSGVDQALKVEPTKVMVLGSAHLAGFETLRAEHIKPLIDRLAEYDPQVITI